MGSESQSNEPGELRLIEPDESWREEFIGYCREFAAAGEPAVHGQLAEAEADFAGLVRRWSDAAAGRGLGEGEAPCSVYWLVRGRRIVGTSRLRHRLTEATAREGGHIGYDVRPSERGHGYAQRLLAMTLEEARRRGMDRVLLTCHKDNLPSARVITKCGGVPQEEFPSPRTGRTAVRYAFDLRRG